MQGAQYLVLSTWFPIGGCGALTGRSRVNLLRVQPLARHLRGTKVLSSSLKFDLPRYDFRD
jgi:hypothetical protein